MAFWHQTCSAPHPRWARQLVDRGSPLPFGNEPVRLWNYRNDSRKNYYEVANAFRQRACSALPLLLRQLHLADVASPMPFGNEPVRLAIQHSTFRVLPITSRQCLSATSLFGSFTAIYTSNVVESVANAFRQRACSARQLTGVYVASASCVVANAFRQRACSAQSSTERFLSNRARSSPMPFGNEPVRLLRLALTSSNQPTPGRQCLSATSLFGSTGGLLHLSSPREQSPMPFGNEPVRL